MLLWKELKVVLLEYLFARVIQSLSVIALAVAAAYGEPTSSYKEFLAFLLAGIWLTVITGAANMFASKYRRAREALFEELKPARATS